MLKNPEAWTVFSGHLPFPEQPQNRTLRAGLSGRTAAEVDLHLGSRPLQGAGVGFKCTLQTTPLTLAAEDALPRQRGGKNSGPSHREGLEIDLFFSTYSQGSLYGR